MRLAIQRSDSVVSGTPNTTSMASASLAPALMRCSTSRIAPQPLSATMYSTNVNTSAKASDVSSWLFSLAMEGCIFSKGMSLPLAAASASERCDSTGRPRPGSPRQAVSTNLAMPSWSQIGTVFLEAPPITRWASSCAMVSRQW